MITSFLRLPGRDRKLLLETLFLMMKVRLMLWVLPFSHIQKSFLETPINKHDIPLERLIWAVKVSSHYVPRATCLTNALTGQSLFLKHGYPCMIKIGVGKSDEGEFEAHAWLEYGDEVVIGESEKEYVPLVNFNKKEKD